MVLVKVSLFPHQKVAKTGTSKGSCSQSEAPEEQHAHLMEAFQVISPYPRPDESKLGEGQQFAFYKSQVVLTYTQVKHPWEDISQSVV